MTGQSTRVGLYHLFGGLLLECPSTETLEELRRSELLATLAQQCEDEALARALRGMQGSLAETTDLDAVRSDYAGLFLGAPQAKAPPWESVYRSPERLVWQEPAYQVLQRYARAGLGYDGMTEVPPDHVGRELLFVASLAAQALDQLERREDAAPPLDARAALLEQRSFLADHVLAWVPRFLEDLRRHAATPFLCHLAEALAAHLTADWRWIDAQASRPVIDPSP